MVNNRFSVASVARRDGGVATLRDSSSRDSRSTYDIMAPSQNNRRLLNFQSTNIGREPSALLLAALWSERLLSQDRCHQPCYRFLVSGKGFSVLWISNSVFQADRFIVGQLHLLRRQSNHLLLVRCPFLLIDKRRFRTLQASLMS